MVIMAVHIAECVLGVYAFDERGKKLGSKPFPRDSSEVASRLSSVQSGTPTPEHRALVAELLKRGRKEFVLESSKLAEELQAEFKRVKFRVKTPNRAGEILRSSLSKLAEEEGVENVQELLREVNLLLTREKLRREAAERDKLVIQSINMLDELDRTANIICGRIRDWYSIHFPELDKLVPDHTDYLRLISELGSRDRFTPEAIKAAGLPEEAERIASAAQSSLGASFDSIDLQAVKECAKQVLAIYSVRERIAEYVDGLMAQIAPNIRALVGGTVGARLISLAGGLQELAKLPASTVQVLGAEKALFRALRAHTKPPKHGVIYQYPDVRGAPKWQRGKIARALAGKLTIAARVDAMSGEFVGDKLAAELRARIADIRTKYEKPLRRR